MNPSLQLKLMELEKALRVNEVADQIADHLKSRGDLVRSLQKEVFLLRLLVRVVTRR